MKPKKPTTTNLEHYFKYPSEPKHRQYEAIRAIVVEKQPVKIVAKRFRYSVNSLYSLVRACCILQASWPVNISPPF